MFTRGLLIFAFLTVPTIAIAQQRRASTQTELGGLFIGEPVSGVQQRFASGGKLVVRVTKELAFREPYGIYNLVDESGHIYGNIGACRGRVMNVMLTITGHRELMAILEKRVEQFGQPKITFPMIETLDGSKAYRDISFEWPNGYSITFPTDDHNGEMGAQSLGNGRCR